MSKIDRSMNTLHPEYRDRFITLEQRLIRSYETGRTQTRFEVFETFRSFERQEYLFTTGTTKARGGQSAHNFGLAVDFVPRVHEAPDDRLIWSWSSHHDWTFLAIAAHELGLCNQTHGLRWDKPHVQVCDWRRVLERTG